MKIYYEYTTNDANASNHVCYKTDAIVCTLHDNCRVHIDRNDEEIHVIVAD